MKKIGRMLFILVMVCVFALAGIALYGYKEYRSYSTQAPITTLVDQVESDPTFVSYGELPKTLVRATVSIEDRRFFEHDGVDYKGLARALASQVLPGLLKSGGSTITQQLAKNLYGTYDSNLQWKTAEFYFAKELEGRYSKEEIFALYVNVINYGNGYSGIYEASQGYFGQVPEDLTDAQCTILAGIPQSPATYELTSAENVQKAKARQKLVLEAMMDKKYLNQPQVDKIYSTTIWDNYAD